MSDPVQMLTEVSDSGCLFIYTGTDWKVPHEQTGRRSGENLEGIGENLEGIGENLEGIGEGRNSCRRRI